MHDLSEPITVSIVVPAYNAAQTIGACLDALLAQQLSPQTACEIIVVDDGSTDATRSIACSKAVRVLTLAANRGRSAARNQGVSEASGEIVLFTDADCEPQPDWVEQMLKPLRADSEVVGVKGAYLCRQPQIVARFTQLELEDKYDQMRKQQQISFIDTYAAAYRRDLFLQNGGFDNGLSYSLLEDQDFSFRLAGRGYKMVFAPDARVYHHHLTSPWRYYRRKFTIGRWKTVILRRHPSRLGNDSRTPLSLKLQFGLALLLSPLLLLLLFVRSLRRPALALCAAFAASSGSFMLKTLRRDPLLLPLTLPLLLLRALGLAHGYVDGLIRLRNLE